jgi:hypothetical protein
MMTLKFSPTISWHTTLTTYHLQSNGQAKSTNQVISLLFTKLVNENRMDWDEHLHMVLYAYQMTFKVTISHTWFQHVYGLCPLMSTKYMMFEQFQSWSWFFPHTYIHWSYGKIRASRWNLLGCNKQTSIK